ncbi:hypothetical protein CLOP_g10749 [Closterium sp. NIES-67]|nr:hypothetical protein CLOP_g20962 [Closterium sp. NIES-67]GJP80544.1 hypothetical protein CLOP_g10749 [Closterium sp. NIES-67]
MEPHRLLASLSKPSDRLFLLRVEDDILRFLSRPWGSSPPFGSASPDASANPRNPPPGSPNARAASPASSPNNRAPRADNSAAFPPLPDRAGGAGSVARQGGAGTPARRRVRPGAEPWTRGGSARARGETGEGSVRPGEAGEGSGRSGVAVDSDTAAGGAGKKIRAEVEARAEGRPERGGEAREEVRKEAGGGAREAESEDARGCVHGGEGGAEARKAQDAGGLAECIGGEGGGGRMGYHRERREGEDEGEREGEEGWGSEGDGEECEGRGLNAPRGAAWAAAAAADARAAKGRGGMARRKGQNGLVAGEEGGREADERGERGRGGRGGRGGAVRGENSGAAAGGSSRRDVTVGGATVADATGRDVTAGGVTVTVVTGDAASDVLLVFPKLRSYHRLLAHTVAKRFGLSSSSYPLWSNTGYKHVCCNLTKEQLISRLATTAHMVSEWKTHACSYVPPLLLSDFIPGSTSRERTLDLATQACPPPKRFSLPITVAGGGRGGGQGGRGREGRGGEGKGDEIAESEGGGLSPVPKRKGRGRFLYHESERKGGVESSGRNHWRKGEERGGTRQGQGTWAAATRGVARRNGFGEHWRHEKGRGEEGRHWGEKGGWEGARGGEGSRGWDRWGEAREGRHQKGREGSGWGGSGEEYGGGESSRGMTAAETVTVAEEDFDADEGLEGVTIARAVHDYRMWQVEEEKDRRPGEGERMRLHPGSMDGSQGLRDDGAKGLPAAPREGSPSQEDLPAASTRHILVVRADLGALEKATGSLKGGTGATNDNDPASAPSSAVVAGFGSADGIASAVTAAQALQERSELLPGVSPPNGLLPVELQPVALVRSAVAAATGLTASVRAVGVASAEEAGETEEAEDAEGTFLLVFASVELAGAAEWRIREARRRARRTQDKRAIGGEEKRKLGRGSGRVGGERRGDGGNCLATGRHGQPGVEVSEELSDGSKDGSSPAVSGSLSQPHTAGSDGDSSNAKATARGGLGESLDGGLDGGFVRAVACCLAVSRFEEASADVLASCHWSAPERRKTRVDGAAAARLLSRSLV